MERDDFLEAGQIINTHGVKGEVKIEPWTDSPDFLKKIKTFYIGGRAVPVVSARTHGMFVIAKLEGVDDINAAMALKNKIISLDRNDAHLEPGRFFIADLIGCKVLSDEGEALGTLTEVLEMPAHKVYVISGKREILVPDVPEFIVSVDPETGLIVHLIEGM